jgi:hypothetical protein
MVRSCTWIKRCNFELIFEVHILRAMLQLHGLVHRAVARALVSSAPSLTSRALSIGPPSRRLTDTCSDGALLAGVGGGCHGSRVQACSSDTKSVCGISGVVRRLVSAHGPQRSHGVDLIDGHAVSDTLTDADVATLRADTPSTSRWVHLNAAGASPLPTPVLEAHMDVLRREAEVGGYAAETEVADGIAKTYVGHALQCVNDSAPASSRGSVYSVSERVVWCGECLSACPVHLRCSLSLS